MSNYIDGFVHPIPAEHLNDYQQVAKQIAEIWKEYGALEYKEYRGDDMVLEGVRSFYDQLGAKQNEVVIFGWVAFESREARDLANEQVSSDPRVAELMSNSDIGFDASRMAYGGFDKLFGR